MVNNPSGPNIVESIIIFTLVSGIAGIEAAYHNCVYQVQLYGPTNFAPVINHVTRFAQEEAQKNVASVSLCFLFTMHW